MRTRVDDLAELVIAATEALQEALRDGDIKHKPGTWAKQTYQEQIDHLSDHLVMLKGNFINENHLTHIVCRAIMAYAIRTKTGI